MGEARNQPGSPGTTAHGEGDLARMSFEDALQELEEIVKSLEGGKGTLAQAIADYERGAALRRHCEAKLAEAEAKVQAIMEGPSGPALRDVE
ncbi:MAG: exodeoxyribonuclease VII small subunit [Acetobacteraceae bacterium]|nr:exodeoxyribonuclease VII small subunit [Acetobacteraceae bacterium]